MALGSRRDNGVFYFILKEKDHSLAQISKNREMERGNPSLFVQMKKLKNKRGETEGMQGPKKKQ